MVRSSHLLVASSAHHLLRVEEEEGSWVEVLGWQLGAVLMESEVALSDLRFVGKSGDTVGIHSLLLQLLLPREVEEEAEDYELLTLLTLLHRFP